MTVVAELDHSQSPAVVTMVVDYGGDDLPDVITEGQEASPPTWVDVSDMNPRPIPGWTTTDGATFTEPPAMANQRDVMSKVHAALNANTTFLGIATPTQAQAVAQVQLLTKQMNALVRLMIGQFDSTSGT